VHICVAWSIFGKLIPKQAQVSLYADWKSVYGDEVCRRHPIFFVWVELLQRNPYFSAPFFWRFLGLCCPLSFLLSRIAVPHSEKMTQLRLSCRFWRCCRDLVVDVEIVVATTTSKTSLHFLFSCFLLFFSSFFFSICCAAIRKKEKKWEISRVWSWVCGTQRLEATATLAAAHPFGLYTKWKWWKGIFPRLIFKQRVTPEAVWTRVHNAEQACGLWLGSHWWHTLIFWC